MLLAVAGKVDRPQAKNPIPVARTPTGVRKLTHSTGELVCSVSTAVSITPASMSEPTTAGDLPPIAQPRAIQAPATVRLLVCSWSFTMESSSMHILSIHASLTQT